jgi:uncharacterized protein
MKPAIIQANSVAPQAWRNGGGQTRELMAWPLGESAWQLRISLADIERNGPFSAFQDVERWFAVVEGAGVRLRFANEEKLMTSASAPFCFAGGAPPDCELIDGPTRDLNLMIRSGSGKMQIALDRLAWRTTATQCGLFTAAAGFVHVGTESFGPIAAHSLVWFDEAPAVPLIFESLHASNNPAGWWLSFTPDEQKQ